jgi:hypothetical protein
VQYEDTIKRGIKEIGCEVMKGIQMDHDRVQWRALVNRNKTPGSTKDGKFLDQLKNYKLLKKDCSMGLGSESAVFCHRNLSCFYFFHF